MPVKTQMIIINKEGVETEVPDTYALQEGEVKKEVVPASPQPGGSEIDFEKEFNALLDENARLAKDRDNYREGLLAAKGKLGAGVIPDGLDLDQLIDKKVQDTLLRTKEFQNEQARKDLISKMIQENKELKLALANRGGISKVAPGGSSARPDANPVPDWTPEQIKYFKDRGLDPNKVKENYSKYKSKV